MPEHGPGPGPGGPILTGFQAGDENFFSGVSTADGLGIKRDTDKIDEKAKLEDIEEIPKIQFIKRIKAYKTYRFYVGEVKAYKRDILIAKRKLEKVMDKLEKYKHMPDDVFGRDKLYKQMRQLKSDISKGENDMLNYAKPKIEIYGKSLGYGDVNPDFFVALTEREQEELKRKQKEEMEKEEQERIKEEKERIEKENEERKNKNNVLNIDDFNPNINNEVKKAAEKQNNINKQMEEEIRRLYEEYADKYVSVYGEESFNNNFKNALGNALSNNEDLKSMIDVDDTMNNIKK